MGIYISEFEREFTFRTLSLLDELDRKIHEYEVTLLINLCVGLIAIPNEYSKRNTSTFEKFLQDYYHGTKVKDVLSMQGVGRGFINERASAECSDIQEAPYTLYLRKFRNALSHGRLKLSGEDNSILFAEFSDRDGSNIKLQIEELKMISKAIANVHLNFYDYISPKGMG